MLLRETLLETSNTLCSRLAPDTWAVVRHLGINAIAATRRGTKAGKRRRRSIPIHISSTRRQPGRTNAIGARFRSLCNLVKIDCNVLTDDQPTSLTSLSLLSLNCRSVVNKTLSINDLIVTRDVDIAALTETWLGTSSDGQVLGELLPRGYDYITVPRRSGQ